MLIKNKKQKTQHEQVKEKSFVKMIVIVYWRQSNSSNSKYMKMGQTAGPMRIIHLNKYEECTFLDKNILLKENID